MATATSTATYTDFALSATTYQLKTQLFSTNSSVVSGGCINNPSTTVLALTGSLANEYIISNLGSQAGLVTFKAGDLTKNFGPIGFTIQPYPSSYSQINYSWFINSTGSALSGHATIYESGNAVTTFDLNTATELKIALKNNNVYYYVNGTIKRIVQNISNYFYFGINSIPVSAQSGAFIYDLNYERYNQISARTAPYTITFQPSSINFDGQFLSKIVYAMPDRVVTRNFTFNSLQDALTGTTKGVDSRSNFVYTFYTFPGTSQYIYNIAVSATLFPSLSTLEYNIQVPVNQPRLTRNPSFSNTEDTDVFVFDSAHILKSRAWGPDNKLMLVVEGVNHDNTSRLFLLSASESVF